MAALTEDRNTKRKEGLLIAKPAAAAAVIYAGGLVALNASGYAVPAADTAGLKCCGVADARCDNASGANGDLSVNCAHASVWKFTNSTGNALDQSHVGSICYVEDDQTVASTSNNLVAAGVVEAIDADGDVWVRVPGDEAALAAVGAAKGRFVVQHLHDVYGGAAYPQDITADAADEVAFIAPRAGTIVAAGLLVAECGADGTDDLYMELDVKINGVSALSTKPKIEDSAGETSANTLAAGDGITQGVIDTDHNTLAAGDVVTVTYDITRTTPEDEMAGVGAVIEIEEALNV